MPEPENLITKEERRGIPDFMREFEISSVQRQAIAIKLDSVIIKGSKILAKHPKSNYIEGTLFLMAKAYFYRNEYLPSQIKCSELVDKYPGGDHSPDAHLLFAKNLLMQRNFEYGSTMLSRTVDIAWQKERYDILSEAFDLQAEVALYQGDKEGALKPYLRAISQSEDSEFAAKMQNDLALTYYRLSMFEEAVDAFRKVEDFNPDYLAQYESQLYMAISLARIGKDQESAEILEYLDDDGKFEEWKPYTYAGKLYLTETILTDTELIEKEKYADTARDIANNRLLAVYYYERGMDYYEKDKYEKANTYLSKSKSSKTPALYSASFYSKNLGDISRYRKLLSEAENPDTTVSDLNANTKTDGNAEASIMRYELARAFERLGKRDSAYKYYRLSSQDAPNNDYSARYYYAWARYEKERENYFTADSILEHIVDNYPRTEYGQAAMDELGFVKEIFVVDTIPELYDSGQQLRSKGEYNYAISQFRKVYQKAKNGNDSLGYAPKALYAIGFTYENDIKRRDSSAMYYYKLLEEYPDSEYAKEFSLSLAYIDALKTGNIPDSLEINPNRAEIPEFEEFKPIRTPVRKKENSIFEDLLSPSKMLERGKNFIMENVDSTVNNFNGLVDSSMNDVNSLREMEMPNLNMTPSSQDTSASYPSDTLQLNAPPPQGIPQNLSPSGEKKEDSDTSQDFPSKFKVRPNKYFIENNLLSKTQTLSLS
ncbi:MAG: hypothetical protein Kapaf2KO_05550 [Candidatus Kapaibacteriales bacterium]